MFTHWGVSSLNSPVLFFSFKDVGGGEMTEKKKNDKDVTMPSVC